VLSDDLCDEILRNLRLKIKLPKNVVANIGELLREYANIQIPVHLPSDACRDPDDIKVLGLAAASNADYIVTGDQDLLVLKNFQGIPILNPRAFSDILHSRQ
jgi:putative PIN family toxin of toxin-antitoxin system